MLSLFDIANFLLCIPLNNFNNFHIPFAISKFAYPNSIFMLLPLQFHFCLTFLSPVPILMPLPLQYLFNYYLSHLSPVPISMPLPLQYLFNYYLSHLSPVSILMLLPLHYLFNYYLSHLSPVSILMLLPLQYLFNYYLTYICGPPPHSYLSNFSLPILTSPISVSPFLPLQFQSPHSYLSNFSLPVFGLIISLLNKLKSNSTVGRRNLISHF